MPRIKRGVGKKTIAIIVDGETEVWYFQMLRETENLGHLNIRPELPEKKTLAYQFDMVLNYAPRYDEVIWLIDFDTIIKENRETSKTGESKFQELRKYLNKVDHISNVHILVNTPCLEFWFLLHQKYTAQYHPKCKPIRNLLGKSNMLPGYAKTEKYYKNAKTNIYQRLRNYLDTACQNGEKLGNFDPNYPESAKAETFKIFKILGLIP